MKRTVLFPRYIYGLHEPGGEWLMEDRGKKGWILFTHGLGHNPDDHGGQDYRRWSDNGFGIIARLNHGYGAAGTIPLPEHYDSFACRVRNFVANSHGCHIWQIGNEMNHGQERPEGQIITPTMYAACYKACWDQIHALPGHQVAIGAVAPWNNTTAYPGNESGNWVQYMVDILKAIRNLGCPVDALTLHTYTHGHDPQLVFSEQKMDPPFQGYHYHFRAYQDFMNAIPQDLRHIPVYITETDQDEAWEDANRGWVQNAYKEIDDWNRTPGNQQIRALILYRWPKFDKWYIEGKTGVYTDFEAALDHGYTWMESENGDNGNGGTVGILNGTFEGDFTIRDGQGELTVAEKWNCGYDSSKGHRPEWKPEHRDIGAGRVHEGDKAQKWFTTYAPHSGWIWQVVEGVEPGALYRLTAMVYVWSSSQDNPNESVKPGKVWVRTGINPWGDGNALSLATQWGTAWVDNYNRWVECEAIVRSKSDRIAVFCHSLAEFGAKHNDVYWDDVRLEKYEAGSIPEPPEPPTPEPGECKALTYQQAVEAVKEALGSVFITVGE